MASSGFGSDAKLVAAKGFFENFHAVVVTEAFIHKVLLLFCIFLELGCQKRRRFETWEEFWIVQGVAIWFEIS